MIHPVSPVTKKNNTSLTDIFLSKEIIRLYKEQLDIDVSRFFENKEEIYLYRDFITPKDSMAMENFMRRFKIN